MKRKNIIAIIVFAVVLSTIFSFTAFGASAQEPTDHTLCEGSGEYCLVCDIANKVKALPDPEDITIDNVASVTQQINDIDRIKYDLTNEEFDELAEMVEIVESGMNAGYPVRYYNAINEVRSISSGGRLLNTKFIILNGEQLRDTSKTEISFEITNLDSGVATYVTMFDLGASVSSLGEEYYSSNADGWTFAYDLPAGRYEIKEINTDKPVAINGRELTVESVSVSLEGSEATVGDTITVELAEGQSAAVVYGNYLGKETFIVVDTEGHPVSDVSLDSKFILDNNNGEAATTDDNGMVEIDGTMSNEEYTLTVKMPDGYCGPGSVSFIIEPTVNSGLVDSNGDEITKWLTYSNRELTLTVHKSQFNSEGFCEYENCGAYQPPISVTAENYETLGLSADYVGFLAVENAGQLYWLSLDDILEQNIVLISDIAVNESITPTDSFTPMKWTPIGSNYYKGIFDGRGHTVSGLYFDDAEASHVGLFASLSEAVLRDFGVVNSYFRASSYVGGIAGSINASGMANVFSAATLAADSYVGGIAGEINSTDVAFCYSASDISVSGDVTEAYAGGIFGYSDNGRFACMYNSKSILAPAGTEKVGPIVGDADDASVCALCYYLEGSFDDGVLSGAEAVSEKKFASGEIAYIMNSAEVDGTIDYRQTIGVDTYPTFNSLSGVVCYGYLTCGATEKIYNNTVENDAPPSHSLGGLIPDVAADCETGGVAAHYICTACENYFDNSGARTVYDALKIPALGHTKGEPVAKVEATCEADGVSEHYVCTACDKYLNSESVAVEYDSLNIPALGHALGDIIPKSEPKCEEYGVKEHYKCERCGKYFDKNEKQVEYDALLIPEAGHKYGEWQTTKEATENTEGERAKTCSECGYQITEKTRALGNPTVAIAALVFVLVVLTTAVILTKEISH